MSCSSVYIHIPYCKTICSYCDFCKVFYNETWVKKYLDALLEEIKDFYQGEQIKTLYIGGGTPSSLPMKHLNRLFEVLSILKTDTLEEFTFECNVNDITEELLECLKKNKVNRLSIGVESFVKEKLHYMGRSHTFEEVQDKVKLVKKYFSNFNIDYIYGFSCDTKKSVKQELKQILSLKPTHISTYSLLVEDSTLLKLNGYERLKDEEDAILYDTIKKILKKHGYLHYEVSNFALKGYESKHNLVYWQNKEYYGFGLSASGYLDQVRYTNTRSLTKYLKGDLGGEKELLTAHDIMDNHIMLGLRLTNGFNIEEFEKRYHVKLENIYPIKPLLKNGDLILKKGNIFINPDKLYIMNEILLKMI